MEMNITPTFSIGIASVSVKEHLPVMRKLFGTSSKKLRPVVEGGRKLFTTTLLEYSADTPTTNHLDEHEELAPLRASIEEAAQNYALVCGYAANKYKPEVANFWLNEMTSGQIHPRHTHYGYNFSGCIYVDMPKGASGISFGSFRDRYDKRALDVEQYTMFNAGGWDFYPTEGQLFIWESWVAHQVNPAQYKGVRRVAGFDVVMKRKPPQKMELK